MNKKGELIKKFNLSMMLALLMLIFITFVGCKKSDTTFKVRFDGNGGTLVSGEEVQSVESANEIVLPKYERDGYDFLGFDVDIATVRKDVTIYANWQKYYIVSFDLNGGSTKNEFKTKVVSLDKYEFNIDITKDGLRFIGYSVNGELVIDSSGKAIKEIILSDGLVFKAEFSDKFYLNINSNIEDAGVITPSGLYKAGEEITLSATPEEGFTFEGWFYDGILLSTDSTYRFTMSSFDTSLEARFSTLNFYVFIRANYSDLGKITVKDYVENTSSYSIFVETNFKLVLIANSLTEQRFLGWYNANNELLSTSTIFTYTVQNNESIIAKWELQYFDISYNLDGGVNPEIQPDKYSPSESTLLFDPIMDGYAFEGWYENADFSGNKITIIPSGSSGNKTFYAKWHKLPYIITYVLNGGTNKDNVPTSYMPDKAVPLPTPTKENYTFEGWYENDDFSGNKINAIAKGSIGDKTFYAKWKLINQNNYEPKWDLNEIDFNGNGMKIVIKVLPVSDYDPFDTNYKNADKTIRQQHQTLVESAYNIKIEYSAWDNEAPWGPDRVNFIKRSYFDGSFKSKGVYVVTLSSQWVPTLVKAQCLAPLYDSASQTGIFANAGYNQDSLVSESASVNKVVYGYSQGAARPDYFMYYNATLVAQCGLEDPAVLWFKGQWNVAKFDELVRAAQSTLGAGQYAIDAGYAEFSIGSVAARGNKMVDTARGRVLFTRQTVTSVFDEMKAYYKNGYWNKGHGIQDVAQNFIKGNTIFHTGSLRYLKESTRFDPNTVAFEIGMVPYPMANDSVATPITEPYTFQDTEGNEVKVEEPLKDRNDNIITDASGKQIYGVDLSASSFLIPFTDTSNYSIMNITNGANGITPEVVFNILYDLVGGQGDDPEKDVMTSDEKYELYVKSKVDKNIYADIIMSVQDKSLLYYEVMETLSMTVGDGSQFGPNAFWPLCIGMMTSEDTPAAKLKEVLDIYQAALESLGY